MQFETELSFKADGEISLSVPHSPIVVNTPGGNKTGLNDENNPIYDNILGHFNLIKTPKMKISVGRKGVSPHLPMYKYNRRFKLEEELKYVLNPSAKLGIKKLMPQYQLE